MFEASQTQPAGAAARPGAGTISQAAPGRIDPFALVARDLEEVERILRQQVEGRKPGLERLTAHLAHYRGKRLRPALLLLVARACGKIVPAHHTLAAVIEMIHTATLVHDDVLDGACVRRHVATVNARWGSQTSILLGDYLFTRAFHLSSTLGDAAVCRLIGEATDRLCEGELHQICQQGNLELTEAEYFDVIDAKTAELTACSCRLGARFAGQPAEVVERLASYGRALGLAFQIADDLLDLVGEEDSAGKSLGTDLEQQKMTLPLIRLLASAPAPQAERLRTLLRSSSAGRNSALRAMLHETGALDDARRRAEEIAARGIAELECLPPSESRTQLAQLAERVVHRDR